MKGILLENKRYWIIVWHYLSLGPLMPALQDPGQGTMFSLYPRSEGLADWLDLARKYVITSPPTKTAEL